ncbi:hypothetical protein WDZ92_00830 [Nostoc sp. NIES-2111]
MKPILRIILASLAGVIATMLAVSGCEALLPLIFERPPMPTGPDADWGAFVEKLSMGVKLGLLAGYAIGGFVGGYVATWATPKPKSITPAVVTAIAFAISGILNFQMIPHPIWMMAVGMILYLATPILGYFAKR